MATLKIIYTDGEIVEEKEIELALLREDLIASDFSRQGSALVQAIYRILRSKDEI